MLHPIVSQAAKQPTLMSQGISTALSCLMTSLPCCPCTQQASRICQQLHTSLMSGICTGGGRCCGLGSQEGGHAAAADCPPGLAQPGCLRQLPWCQLPHTPAAFRDQVRLHCKLPTLLCVESAMLRVYTVLLYPCSCVASRPAAQYNNHSPITMIATAQFSPSHASP